jgi:hypothetical protein
VVADKELERAILFCHRAAYSTCVCWPNLPSTLLDQVQLLSFTPKPTRDWTCYFVRGSRSLTVGLIAWVLVQRTPRQALLTAVPPKWLPDALLVGHAETDVIASQSSALVD